MGWLQFLHSFFDCYLGCDYFLAILNTDVYVYFVKTYVLYFLGYNPRSRIVKSYVNSIFIF